MTVPDERREAEPAGFGHVARGPGGPESRMVDVGAKPPTRRTATARARILFPPGLLAELRARGGPKGPVEEVSRTAGILAAKRTGDLIPMCHPLGLEHVEVRFDAVGDDVLEVTCRASCTGPTGVEMEAMTGAAVAALTVYDMTKGRDKSIRLERVELLEKTGGRSGTWRRDDAGGA